jgi:hypothetical protein
MDQRRWSVAEQCLTEECRQHYADSIADRSLFDFYSPYGYRVEGTYKFVPNWQRGEVTVNREKGTARARIVSKVFVVGGNEASFSLSLKRGRDGLWRVNGPRVDMQHYYDRYIAGEARGWAARAERK